MTRITTALLALCLAGCATVSGRFNEVRFTLVSACQGIVLEPEANVDVVNACKRILALNDTLPALSLSPPPAR